MSKEDQYSGLSWMTDEMKNHIYKRDKIVKEQDINALFSLQDNADFSIALHEILMSRFDQNRGSLKQPELNLFLCMHLENASQADSILSFLQEWFPKYNHEVVMALKEIGAIKSAEIIKQAIELLPVNGSWFFDSADEGSQTLMSKLDREFSNYPDGLVRDLYRKYAENNRNEIG